MMTFYVKCFFGVFVWLALASSVQATQKLYTQVPVFTILIQEGLYGGCAVKTNLTNLSADGLSGCQDQWLSMDCDGAVGSKSVASAKLGAVQLAYVAQRKINVVVDDAVKPQGACFASRVDNAP